MDEAAALERALANTTQMVQGIGTDQWGNSTPCDKWNVRQLVTHTVGVMANFSAAAADQPLVGDPDDFDLGADPAATIAAVAANNVAAWKERGELQSEVTLGDNKFPGMVGISINMLDAYVHGWDIAKATGQDCVLDSEMCGSLLGFAQQAIPESPREGDNFHAVVATGDEAGSAEQLLGYLGRQP